MKKYRITELGNSVREARKTLNQYGRMDSQSIEKICGHEGYKRGLNKVWIETKDKKNRLVLRDSGPSNIECNSCF